MGCFGIKKKDLSVLRNLYACILIYGFLVYYDSVLCSVRMRVHVKRNASMKQSE